MILIVLPIRVTLNKIDQSIDFDTWSISVIDMKKFLFFSWWNENHWKSYRFSLPLLWLLNSIFFLIFNQHFGNLWEFCCFCFYFFSLFIQIFKFKTQNLEIFFSFVSRNQVYSCTGSNKIIGFSQWKRRKKIHQNWITIIIIIIVVEQGQTNDKL